MKITKGNLWKNLARYRMLIVFFNKFGDVFVLAAPLYTNMHLMRHEFSMHGDNTSRFPFLPNNATNPSLSFL